MNTQAGGFNVLLYHRPGIEATKNRPLDLGRLFARRRCFAPILYYFQPAHATQNRPQRSGAVCDVIGMEEIEMKHATGKR